LYIYGKRKKSKGSTAEGEVLQENIASTNEHKPAYWHACLSRISIGARLSDELPKKQLVNGGLLHKT
jgi:hypothetical protein